MELQWKQRVLLVVLLLNSISRPASPKPETFEIRETNVILLSPSFPNNYPPNSSVEWRVSLSTVATYTVTVNKLSLEKSDGCKFDSLTIGDPKQTLPALGPLCGNDEQYFNLSTSIQSYGLTVSFTSDGTVQSRGFSLNITATRFPANQLCDEIHDRQARRFSSYLAGERDKYPTNLNCTWIVQGPSNKQIVLHFERLDIEFSGPDCPYDYIEIWDVSGGDNSPGDRFLTKLCGRHPPWEMTTYSSKLLVHLISDDLDNTGGFVIDYDSEIPLVGSPSTERRARATPVPQSEALLGTDFKQSFRLIWKFRTHPGFAVHLRTPHLSRTLVSLHDGPDTSFEAIAVYENQDSVSSKGFHLVAKIDVSPDERLRKYNITFRSWSIIRRLHSPKGKIFDRQQMSYRLHYLTYVPLIINPAFRLNVLLRLNLLRNLPSTDNCAYAGLALYDGVAEFGNVIGPFCDTYENYAQTLIETLVASTWVLHVCFYDYTSRFPAPIEQILDIFPSKCRGHILTEESFQQQQSLSSGSAIMSVGSKEKQWNINITYTESQNDCVRVKLIPYFPIHKDVNVHIWLNGSFLFRICRQWATEETNGKRKNSVISKYDPENRCTDQVQIANSTRELIIPLFQAKIWSMEYISLELGAASSDVCEDVVTCIDPGDQVLHLACGVIYIVTSQKCQITLVLPEEMQSAGFYWYLKVNLILAPRGGLSVVKISEEHRKLKVNVSSAIHSPFRDVSIRPYHYYSMQDVDLTISPEKVFYLKIYFDTLKLPPLQYDISYTPQDEECYSFEDHCYTFIQHPGSTSWRSAQNTCEDSGGNLVSVNSWAELQFLKTALSTVWFDQFYGNGRGLIYVGLQDKEKANDYRWVDGSPLTITDWYYPFDKDNNLPYNPPPPINPNLIQPDADRSQRCVAMVPGNPQYSTNWRKVGCELTTYSSPVYSICEFNNTENQTERWKAETYMSKYQCEDGWNFVNNTCLAVLTKGFLIDGSFKSGEVKTLCTNIGGMLPRVDTMPTDLLHSFLVSKGFTAAISDIWVRSSSGEVICVSIIGNRNHVVSESDTCYLTAGVRWIAICEREPVESKLECPTYQFSCDDGTCLNPDRVCDHNNDCDMGEDEFNCSLSDVFRCYSGHKVSIFKYCDFQPDCPDGSDEELCVHPACSGAQYKCENGQCISTDLRCDHKGDCVDGSDEEGCDWETECSGFSCPLAGCVIGNQVADLQADCPDKSDADENFPSKIGFDWDCPGHMDQIRCHRDHIKCFPTDKVCVFEHDVYGQLKYCRNGAHLRRCEDFQCPNMFKCPGSYCIPYHKVCDGVQDCVRGEDEFSCDNDKSCPGRLRCGSSTQCVSQDDVCNQQVDCKQGWTDERFCDLRHFSCPLNCTCVGYYVNCQFSNLQDVFELQLLQNTRVLDLRGNNISLSNDTFGNIPYLAVLYLQQNDILSLPPQSFSPLYNLLVLDLRDNKIEIVHPDAFFGLQNLQTLKLLGNPIHQISEFSFRGLSSLPLLNLSGMNLDRLGPRCFAGLDSLKSLDVSNNKIKGLSADTFASVPPLEILLLENNLIELPNTDVLLNLDVRILRMDSFRHCCAAGKSVGVCFPPADLFSSCADLIPNTNIRVVVWGFAVLAVLGNGFVISWRIYKKTPNVPSVLIFHLSLSDFLMGLYLLSLSIADSYYRDIYILHDIQWRHSVYCKLIGVTGFISCEMSMFTLVLIAVDRTKKFAFPISPAQFTVSDAWKAQALGWIICTILSVLPFLLPSYFTDYYGRNTICLPFNFADPRGAGWEMTTVIFVGVNTTGLLMISIMYVLIFSRVKQAQKQAGRDDGIEVEVARKLSIVILTDVACLLPIILANLTSVLGHPVDRGMASVLATLVLPLNAALNPFLFTITNWKILAMLKTKTVLTSLSIRSAVSQKGA